MANGEPIPEEYRPLVTEILKRSTINKILEVEHYRKRGVVATRMRAGCTTLRGEAVLNHRVHVGAVTRNTDTC